MIVGDIETLPCKLEDVEKIKDELRKEDVKPPKGVTKGDLLADLGNDKLKHKNKDELIPIWVEECGDAYREKYVDEQLRARSLNGSKGIVFSIGFKKVNSGEYLDYTFNTDGHGDSEKELLLFFRDEVQEMCRLSGGTFTPPYFILHNAIFDLHFLYKRFVINGISPGFQIPFTKWHGKDYYCTSQAWTGSRDIRVSQNDLCETLGLEKKPDDINGSNVFDHALKGDWNRIREYNKYDVETCEEIYKRLTFQ